MWILALLAPLLCGDADARPLPTVTVRPLPAPVRPVVTGTPSKAELIASSYVEYTVVHTAIGKVEGEDGGRLPFPSVFTCVVGAGVLTVSYTREGIDPAALPETGSCGTGEAAVHFRIQVEPIKVEPIKAQPIKVEPPTIPA